MCILFVGTNASLSGAPQILERVEAHIAAQPGIRIGTLPVLRLDADLYQSTWQILTSLYAKVESGGSSSSTITASFALSNGGG